MDYYKMFLMNDRAVLNTVNWNNNIYISKMGQATLFDNQPFDNI